MIDQKTLVSPGYGAITARVAIPAKATVQVNDTGKAMPVTTADFAAVANRNTQTSMATSTATLGAATWSTANNANEIQQPQFDGDGNILMVSINAGKTAANVRKLTPGGLLLAMSVDLPCQTGVDNLMWRVGVLSNTNVAACWYDTNSGALRYAVFDKSLSTVIKASTSVGAHHSNSNVGFAKLAGGGFVTMRHDSTNKQTKIQKYDNTGTITVPEVVTRTWVGTAGIINVSLAELPGGNIATTYSPNYSTDVGLWVGVVSPSALANVTAPVLKNASVTSSAQIAEIAIGAATFAFMAQAITPLPVYICDLTGAAVATFNPGGSAPQANLGGKVITDGTAYYACYFSGAGKITVDKFDATGSRIGNVTPTTSAGATSPSIMDAAWCDGFIFVITNMMGGAGGIGASAIFDCRQTQPIQYKDEAFGFGASSGAGSVQSNSLLPYSGDYVICGYGAATDAVLLFSVKITDTAILGQAPFGQATPGQPVQFTAGSGAFQTAINGTAPKAFDHTATTIPGTKGTMLGASIVTKGL